MSGYINRPLNENSFECNIITLIESAILGDWSVIFEDTPPVTDFRAVFWKLGQIWTYSVLRACLGGQIHEISDSFAIFHGRCVQLHPEVWG